jgi:hypothetical protein
MEARGRQALAGPADLNGNGRPGEMSRGHFAGT